MASTRYPVLVYSSGETNITAAGSTVNWNMSNLFNQLAGEYRKSKKRAYALGCFITLRVNLTADAGGSVIMPICDRLPCFQVNVQTPTLTDNHTNEAMNALSLYILNQINNPIFKLFADKVPGLRGFWAPFTSVIEAANLDSGFVWNANRNYDDLDRAGSWGLDLNPVFLRVLGGGVISEVIDPIPVPFCYFSGVNAFGGPVEKDRLPLDMVVNNATPWIVSLTHLANQSLQQVLTIFSGAVAGSVTVNARIHIVVSSADESDSYGFGVPITNRLVPLQAGGTFEPTTEAYRFLGVLPKTNLPLQPSVGFVTDNYGLLMQPDNWTIDLDNALFRQRLCSTQVFPLTFSSLYGHMINAWNGAADDKANPRLWFDYDAVNATVFKSTTSGLAGLNVLNQFVSYMGYRTRFPVFPLINNSMSSEGFQTGVMPINDSEKISIDFGPGLTSDQASRVFGSVFSRNRPQDIKNIAQWEVYGCQPCASKNGTIGQYRVAVNNPNSYNNKRYMNYLPVVKLR